MGSKKLSPVWKSACNLLSISSGVGKALDSGAPFLKYLLAEDDFKLEETQITALVFFVNFGLSWKRIWKKQDESPFSYLNRKSVQP